MKKRFLSILLVLVMVIGMIPFSALSASAEGLADYYKTITIGNDVYDVATMPGNHSGEGYSITSTGPASLVINLNNYNGGPIEVDTTDTILTKINVYGDCVINAPSGYAIKFASDFSNKTVSITIADDSSLTITGQGGISLSGGDQNALRIIGGVTSKLNINATNGEALRSISASGSGLINMNGDFNAIIESPKSITCDTDNSLSTGLMPRLYFDFSDHPNFKFIKSNTTGDYAIPNVNKWWEYRKYDNKIFYELDGKSVLIQRNRTLTANGGATIYVDGSAKGSTATVEPCTSVKIVAPEIDGKYFTGWEFSREDVPFTEEEKKQSELTFDMPNCDLTATATYIDLDMGFASLTPTPDMPEEDWDELTSDLGTMALGSADTNITFNFSAKTLSAEAIAAGYSVKRALKVTRDGITIYDREYASNEAYGWNLKDNIDEGGNYHIIPTLNYYLDGVKIEKISHLYTVKVTGSTIKTISLVGIGTPVIGKAPSTIDTAISNTDGVSIKKVQWEYWTSEMGGVWVNMPDDSVFEEGKRYAVLLELKAEDSYSFAANKTDMTVYINGEACNVLNHNTSETAADLEFTPITDPAFTTQPVGGWVAEGDKLTVDWELNFTPAKIELRYFDNALEESRPTFIDTSISSADFAPIADDGSYYQILAYYNNTQYVAANKFYVYEIKTIVNSIELEVAKPVIGEAPTKPTIKSVNGDENLKDLVSFFSDSKVYWVEADSAEDIANGTKNPTVFANGKIYALHVAIQSTKEIAEDCVLNVYGTDGELLWSGNISFSDPSDKTLVYTDAYLGNFKLEIGDVNENGTVDFSDLQRLYQHLTEESLLTGDALAVANVNGDSNVDFSDLQALFALVSQNA